MPVRDPASDALSERDSQLLAFEARWLGHTGAKEEAIRVELQLTPARYYQLLGRLIDSQAALAQDPLLVGRLRRIRDERRRERSTARRGA
ncbi:MULTISPECIES: DUF3263 domain-containing protein [Microbacterium]|uniref:DUF3263 domain-containing protein n=1 Tax=Microbacterium TaxID=33882 RepID=UPI001EF1123F|nr:MULTISPECIES: DUF3263 domain-containing protein [Microbacterium]UIN31566.1 DUF3263 domain-containing protein [Microbacterium binotii]